MPQNLITQHPVHGTHEVFGRPLSLVLVVGYKAFLGLVETIVGAGLAALTLFVSAPVVTSIVKHVITEELSEDPQDRLANWVLTHNLPLGSRTALYASLVVLGLGVLKLVVAVGIWRRSFAARNITMALVGILGLFGVAELMHSFSWFKVVTVTIDVVLFYYLWRILPRYLVAPSVSEPTH
jgi:uncharacterized membrane protein